MPPKAKGKATAGAAAALASALGVEKFTRIKHGDLQRRAVFTPTGLRTAMPGYTAPDDDCYERAHGRGDLQGHQALA